MQINKLSTGILILLFIAFTSKLYAQEEEKNECVINLEQAQEKYNQGRIQDVEALIGDCINGNNLNKADKTQALKLLTLAHIFLKELDLAENSMLQLLQINHEFQINEAVDPSEFINLYNKYRTEPVVGIGILGNVALAQPIVTQLNNTQNISENRQKYGLKVQFGLELNVEYKLFDHWFVNPGVSYKTLAFTKTNEYSKIVSNEYNGIFEGELNFKIVEVPLVMKYEFMEGNFIPYASAGLVPQLFIDATYPGDATSSTIDGSPDVTLSTRPLIDDVNKFNFAASIGGGVKIKVPAGFINARIQYTQNFRQVFKENSALNPSDPNLIWDLYESLDGFRMHDLTISIGYIYNVFIPKKIR